jgi:magnesium transporter
MVRSIYYSNGNEPERNLSIERLKEVVRTQQGLLWVSLEQPTDKEITEILRDTFHFHPLAIEDAQSRGYQSPKIDDFGSYLFIIAHAMKPDSIELNTMELNCFLGEHYLVTSYLAPSMPPIAETWKRLDRDERLVGRGSDFLLHAILDILVDEYMPVLDHLDEEIEFLEDQVIEQPKTTILERILDAKHRTMVLRRIISPQREVMNRLSRDDLPQIKQQSRIYYRDIYDHLVRIQDLSESIRDIISSSLDIYLSATSNRLNQIMKALTIVSTIFLPMSFFAGVWGMNFVNLPEIHWKYGYAMAWAVFISIPVVMLIYFKKKGWF